MHSITAEDIAFAEKIAHRFGRGGFKKELVSAAYEGLCEAASRYRPDRKTAFTTWAFYFIKRHLVSEWSKCLIVYGTYDGINFISDNQLLDSLYVADKTEEQVITKDLLYKFNTALKHECGRGFQLKNRLNGYTTSAIPWSVRKRFRKFVNEL